MPAKPHSVVSMFSRARADRRRADDPNSPAVCPQCGAALDIVTDGYIGKWIAPGYAVIGRELERQMIAAPFGACPACEFCIEIRIRS